MGCARVCCPGWRAPRRLGEMISAPKGSRVGQSVGPSRGGREAGKDGAAMLFLRTGRQIFLSCGRARCRAFLWEPGQRAHNRPGVACGLRQLISFDSARPALGREDPAVPAAAPPLPERRPSTAPSTWSPPPKRSWTEGVISQGYSW